MMDLPIYLDNLATTPLDPVVRVAMLPLLGEDFGNPHSASHAYGWRAEAAVDKARAQVAAIIGARAEEIIFTGTATEANNLALKGLMAASDRTGLVTVATEHKCVLECAKVLGDAGFSVTILPVDGCGLIDLDQLRAAVDDKTALVSIMAVNNEIGVIQPLQAIAEVAHAVGAYFHCDAAQAFGKIPLDVHALGIDLLSISGHKIYGPKGIGALYINADNRPPLVPLIHGGGQERGLRSGTLAPALIAGMGAAAAEAARRMEHDEAHVAALAKRFRKALTQELPLARFNGEAETRWPGVISLTLPDVRSDALFSNLKGVAVSPGAACASGSAEPSYVLEAIGLSKAEAESTIRLGIGRFNSAEDIDRAAQSIVRAARHPPS